LGDWRRGLKALLADLATAEAQADLTTLGLTAEVTTLVQTQQAFDALVEQRGPEDKAKKDIPSLPVVRELLREDVSVIRESLASGERRLPGTYAALAADLSVHITSTVAAARARRTRRTTDTPVPTQPQPSAA
jgi:hypothetical protein